MFVPPILHSLYTKAFQENRGDREATTNSAEDTSCYDDLIGEGLVGGSEVLEDVGSARSYGL